jgi:hypothetical protein
VRVLARARRGPPSPHDRGDARTGLESLQGTTSLRRSRRTVMESRKSKRCQSRRRSATRVSVSCLMSQTATETHQADQFEPRASSMDAEQKVM